MVLYCMLRFSDLIRINDNIIYSENPVKVKPTLRVDLYFDVRPDKLILSRFVHNDAKYSLIRFMLH